MWEDKSGSGLWIERVNTLTGESSIKEHIPKVVAKGDDLPGDGLWKKLLSKPKKR